MRQLAYNLQHTAHRQIFRLFSSFFHSLSVQNNILSLCTHGLDYNVELSSYNELGGGVHGLLVAHQHSDDVDVLTDSDSGARAGASLAVTP